MTYATMRNSWVFPALVTCTYAIPGHATQYLTIAEAQKLIFPEATRFVEHVIVFTQDQKHQIEEASGVTVRSSQQKIWKAFNGDVLIGYFVLDEVIGKHEFITYALGINNKGDSRQIEILNYRESYGGQVRDIKWRKQFIGKSIKDPLKLDNDIVNLSGATLSSRHITDGVKRLLHVIKVTLAE